MKKLFVLRSRAFWCLGGSQPKRGRQRVNMALIIISILIGMAITLCLTALLKINCMALLVFYLVIINHDFAGSLRLNSAQLHYFPDWLNWNCTLPLVYYSFLIIVTKLSRELLQKVCPKQLYLQVYFLRKTYMRDTVKGQATDSKCMHHSNHFIVEGLNNSGILSLWSYSLIWLGALAEYYFMPFFVLVLLRHTTGSTLSNIDSSQLI